jgi:hypothetical protein
MATVWAISLPGSFDMVPTSNLLDANSTTVSDAAPSSTFDVYYDTTNRTKQNAATSLNKYIQVDADLRSLVTFTNNGTTISGDDIWGFKSISVSKLQATQAGNNIVYNLPTANADLLIKNVSLFSRSNTVFKPFQYSLNNIDWIDVNTAETEFYPDAFSIYTTIVSDVDGWITSANTEFRTDGNFSTLYVRVAEDMTLAQTLGFSYDTEITFEGTPSSTTPDTNLVNITAADITSNFTTKLNAVRDLYLYQPLSGGVNNRVFTDWTISFNGEKKSDYSTIAKHARHAGWQTTNTSTIFSDLDRIVTTDSFALVLKVLNGEGVETTIIDSYVHGVLRHVDNYDNSNYTIVDLDA